MALPIGFKSTKDLDLFIFSNSDALGSLGVFDEWLDMARAQHIRDEEALAAEAAAEAETAGLQNTERAGNLKTFVDLTGLTDPSTTHFPMDVAKLVADCAKVDCFGAEHWKRYFGVNVPEPGLPKEFSENPLEFRVH